MYIIYHYILAPTSGPLQPMVSWLHSEPFLPVPTDKSHIYLATLCEGDDQEGSPLVLVLGALSWSW